MRIIITTSLALLLSAPALAQEEPKPDEPAPEEPAPPADEPADDTADKPAKEKKEKEKKDKAKKNKPAEPDPPADNEPAPDKPAEEAPAAEEPAADEEPDEEAKVDKEAKAEKEAKPEKEAKADKEPKPEKPPKGDKPPKEAAADSDEGMGGMLIALKLGPAIPLSQLGVGFIPRLEIGAQLPPMDGRLRMYLTAAWTKPVATATYADDRVPDGSWDYTLRQSYTMLGGGAAFAILDPSGGFVPELSVAPQVHLLRSRVDGFGGSSTIGITNEYYGQFGVRIAAGARIAAGPGEVTIHVDTSITGFEGRVTGEVGAGVLAPAVGYGIVF